LTPRFIYLIAAYNEAAILERTTERLAAVVDRFPGSLAYLLDNGSVDDTWQIMQRLERRFPWVIACHDDQKGMGVAYRRGLMEVLRCERLLPLLPSDRLVLTAADLPFGFTDIEAVLALPPHEQCAPWLFVGSKAHPRSKAPRGVKRRIGSWFFRGLRRLVLGLRTADTQGTLLIRGDLVPDFLPIRSNDFFFAVEIVDRAERFGSVRELPVVLEAERRPSSVRLVRDGWKMARQLIEHRRLCHRQELDGSRPRE
jgi:glycosyltransferase involved in cell wall biosynthesis